MESDTNSKRMISMLFTQTNNELVKEGDASEETIEGRSFVLGTPDKKGQFHIFIDDRVWNIRPGDYGAGDRVYVTEVSGEFMTVCASMCTEGVSGVGR